MWGRGELHRLLGQCYVKGLIVLYILTRTSFTGQNLVFKFFSKFFLFLPHFEAQKRKINH